MTELIWLTRSARLNTSRIRKNRPKNYKSTSGTSVDKQTAPALCDGDVNKPVCPEFRNDESKKDPKAPRLALADSSRRRDRSHQKWRRAMPRDLNGDCVSAKLRERRIACPTLCQLRNGGG